MLSNNTHFDINESEIQFSILSTIINMLISRKWINDDFDKHYQTITDKDNLKYDNLNLIDTTTINCIDKNVAVKFYKSKLQTFKDDKEINTFLAGYHGYHKILIVLDISNKAEKQASDIKDFEIFKNNEVVRDISKHHFVPKHILLSKDENSQVMEEYNLKKKDMGRIYINDPMARYLYAKKDDIIQIIRPTVNAGYSTYYRLVVNNSIYN